MQCLKILCDVITTHGYNYLTYSTHLVKNGFILARVAANRAANSNLLSKKYIITVTTTNYTHV
jgi:hypothetical protein